MKPAAGYLRRSTTKQEMSLAGQREGIEKFANAQGYVIVRTYCDDGISGASGESRPEFLRMIQDAKLKGDFEAVICYDLSRFGRMDSDEIGHYRFLLKQAGVQILFSNESDGGSGEMGEIIRPVLQSQKRQFLRQLSRDTLRGQIQAANAGWASGRAAPFGFDRILVDERGVHQKRLKRGESYAKPRSWHVAIIPSDTPGEVQALQGLFTAYLEREVGFSQIAKELNERGVPSPHGGTWCLSTIRSILTNPVYAGRLVTGRRAMGVFHRLRGGESSPVSDAAQKIEHRPQEAWIVRPCPALVTQEVWDGVQKKMAAKGDQARRTRSRRVAYPLGGIVKCANCGSNMVGLKRESGKQIYICASHFRNRSCSWNPVQQVTMMNVLKNVIKNKLFFGGDMAAFQKALVQQVQASAGGQRRDTAAIKAHLREAQADLDRAAKNLLRADPENVPALNSAMSEIRTRVRTLDAEIKASQDQAKPDAMVAEIMARAERLLDDLFNAQGDRLKAVLSELVDRIELKFEEALKGKRRIRVVSGCDVYLRAPLTTGGRGDRI